ncbi:sigma-54 dependent transcriptional regulator [Pacificibacter sp. AS14]|uniref:sigma-54-dependent transcriptional regulator n=1 Tax=Pacificibacter sp. AS14 TaxID=3135785 RepID=UPI0031787AD3
MNDPQAIRVLVVDDDKSMRVSLMDLLEAAGFAAEALPRADQVADRLPSFAPDVIVSDVRMPGMSGLDLLASLPKQGTPPLVLISAHGDIPMAVKAMQDGAYSFVEKPYEPRRLLTILRHAAEQYRLLLGTERLKARLAELSGLDRVFLGRTDDMVALREEILNVSASDAPLLLLGETGTGKELVARALHDLGPRSDGAFVAINCATLTPENFERDMFGIKGGPAGKIISASGGTLFLDEIGACPMQVQAMLLRVIEQRETIPIGALTPVKLDLRVVSATNESPDDAVMDGRLRRDLLFRINTVTLNMPSLRERRDDIAFLFTHFVAQYAQVYEVTAPDMTQEDIAALLAHDWPGNVRELRNVAERRVLAAKRGLGSVTQALQADHAFDDVPNTLREAVASFERELIAKAIKAHEGRMDAVAEALGIGRRTLNEKIVKLGLNKDDIL